MGKAILNSLSKNKSGEVITTLIDEFKYPKYGPGMLWETVEKLTEKNHKILFKFKVVKIKKETDCYSVQLENGDVHFENT